MDKTFNPRREFLGQAGCAIIGMGLAEAGRTFSRGVDVAVAADAAPVARTALGRLHGVWNEGVAVFRGVPYAEAPVGKRRFAAPVPIARWQGSRDATRNGPISLQPPSRLAMAMGDIAAPQGEDCLTVTVFTPAPDGGKRPVLVWLHGGGYSSGAGSLPWYSGANLAREGDIVVVSVNYRLGALGYFYWPGLSLGHMGSLDQLSALTWVHDHIAAFGGDPARVTVAGQSGGAMDIVNLLTTRSAHGLFQRAILQSGALGSMPPSVDQARKVGEAFLQELGMSTAAADANALLAMPADRILAAQVKVAAAAAAAAPSAVPFRPVANGQFLPEDITTEYPERVAGQVDLMVGITREEGAPRLPEIDRDTLDRRLAALFRNPESAAAVYARLRPGATAKMLLVAAQNDTTFLFPSARLAERQSARNRKAYVYQFDWQSPRPGFGACHTLELPFVFGTFDAFSQAPMMAGSDMTVASQLSLAMRRSWIGFVRDGDPNHSGLPPWDVYEPVRRITMRFDTVCGPAGDLGGYAWRSPAVNPALQLI